MPVTPWVGYKPKTWVQSNQWLGYTAMWNLLNYAGVTVPVATVDPVLDQPGAEWVDHVPRNESDAFNHSQCEFFSSLSFWEVYLWLGAVLTVHVSVR